MVIGFAYLVSPGLAGGETFQSVNLPYNGPGCVWILDDGWVIVQIGKPQDNSPSAPAAVAKGGHQPDFHMLALDGSHQELVLVNLGSRWWLQPSSVVATIGPREAAKLNIVPILHNPDAECRRQSQLDVVGAVRLAFDAEQGFYTLKARDTRQSNTLEFVFKPVTRLASQPDPGEQGDPEHYTMTCEIDCGNGGCTASVTCLKGGELCWVKCWCDQEWKSHCASGHGQMPVDVVANPTACFGGMHQMEPLPPP